MIRVVELIFDTNMIGIELMKLDYIYSHHPDFHKFPWALPMFHLNLKTAYPFKCFTNLSKNETSPPPETVAMNPYTEDVQVARFVEDKKIIRVDSLILIRQAVKGSNCPTRVLGISVLRS